MQNSSERDRWKDRMPAGPPRGGQRAAGNRSGLRRILFTLAGLFLLFLVWLLRPGDPPPVITLPPPIPGVGFSVEDADDAIRRRELAAGPLRPDNHARIVWNGDHRNRKAPCSIVYLHGFSASYGEGSPVLPRLSRDLGCHLYISRLHGHGLRTSDPLSAMQPDSLIADAARALAIGHLLGEKVILIGNSMGGLLALHLAGSHPERVDALVLFAPLLDFATPASRLFDKTWAQRLYRLIMGEPYIRFVPDNDGHARYWYSFYHLGSMAVLQSMRRELVDDSLYARITQPVFTGYYYKDDKNQDQIVSVSAIREMEVRLGTPPQQRDFHAFPDAEAHVITSSYRAREYDQVHAAVSGFLRRQLADP